MSQLNEMPNPFAAEGPSDQRAKDTSVVESVIVPLWRQRLRIFLQNKLAIGSVIYLVIVVLFCYLGPIIWHFNETNQAAALFSTTNAPPSLHHILGTDGSGFDEFGRIMYGGEYSLSLGMLAGVITIVVGTIYGMISGFIGGVVDSTLMRILDAFLSIPIIFLLLTLITIFPRTSTSLIIIIGIIGWFGNARIIRGDALVIKELEYSQASRAMGAGWWHIIRRHVFPNSVSNIVTVATFAVADAILFLTTLGYLGLGIPAPATDWGTMLNNAAGVQPFYWWQVYPLAAFFILVIVAITYIGEALRDAFEVRLLER
ncbi:MAG: ABC transporter permease [Actinomycetota bacterium]|nr:ABC transporter permease [Actinomycetota bacterium]